MTPWKTQAESDLAEKVGKTAVPTPTSDQVKAIQSEIQKQYSDLLNSMLKSKSCAPAVEKLSSFFAAMLEAETYEDFTSQQSISKTPELALEYDLNTPQNKPSYSSVKGTMSWSFGAPRKPVPAKPSGEGTATSVTQASIRGYAQTQATVVSTAAPSGASMQAGKQAAANAKPQAQANVSPWSLTMNGTADIYNGQPPSTVPSATHVRDLQAGAELSYLFTPSGNSGAFRTLIGPVTAAAAYSYEDQTSPAILTGPALTDFTGLPS